MPDVTVYFATNRRQTGVAGNGNPIFGIDVMPFTRESPVYSAVEVAGVDLADAARGTIGVMRPLNGGRFADDVAAEITAAGNVLVFIHGMANSFEDAITRAAFNQAWFAASGLPGAKATVIAFTWPSDHYVVAPPPLLPTTAYRRDQLMAAESDVHLVRFLNEIYRLLEARPNDKRVVLLAHSMGNFVLGGAVEKLALLSGIQPPPLFNQAVLAAADEVFTSFVPGNGIRLAHLGTIAARTAVYFNRHDVAMLVSEAVNDVDRLGDDGPFHRNDPGSFPRATYDLADCSWVHDYDWVWPVDSTHQYYRRSARVRDDIAALIAGVAPKAGSRTYPGQPAGTAVYTL